MKVIGFDSWTGGVQNYQRIVREFQSRGWQFRVVHIGSWGGDVRPSPVDQINGVDYRDITAYSSNRLDDVLDEERPDAVVFLSIDTFAHRAFNRLAMRRGIPTLHLYHGLVSVQEVGEVRQYKINLLAQMRFVLERIPKALWFIWPAYASAMLKTGATRAEWARFVGDIAVMARGRRPHTAAPDARTTRCCVYTEADMGHAIHRYGFHHTEVVPVGNPDLHHFGLTTGDICSRLDSAKGDEVMYIDTGLVYTGFVFSSAAQFVRHLIHTRDALAVQGLHLLFKPHPDHQRSGLLDKLTAAGIELCSRGEFVPRLRSCRAALVEPSSLSVIPALMGLPLLLNNCGALSGQLYGKVLISYPRHERLQELEQCLASIELAESQPDVAATRSWIERNAGPLPSKAMPARVADFLSQMVASSSKPLASI